MVLYLQQSQLDAIAAHAQACYPDECCGVLYGKLLDEIDRQVIEVQPVPNSWTPEVEAEHQRSLQAEYSDVLIDDSCDRSKQDRFYIDPRHMLMVQKCARENGWQIIGIYHSHPDHPAEPSERDRQSAWPEYSYVILSVQLGKLTEYQSWRLDEQGQFEPEVWQFRD